MTSDTWGMLRDEIAQVDRSLDRLISEPTERTRREAAEDVLHLRIGWLYDITRPHRLGTAWVSVLEYGLFLGETGARFDRFPPLAPRWSQLAFEELVKPVTGVPYAGAVAFCDFVGQRAAAGGEPFHARLPTVEEARYPLAASPTARVEPMPRSALLSALFDERDIGTWCQDREPQLATASTPSWLGGFVTGVARLLDLDAWLLSSTSLLTFLRCGMPPLRRTDDDFNENWQSDRRWVELYASSLDEARQVMQTLGAGDRQVAALLDFDPFHQLCGSSPLDSHRSDLLAAYRIVAGQVMGGERQAPADAAFDAIQLADAVGRLPHRGLDLARTRDELLAGGATDRVEHAAVELARAATAREPAPVLDSARLHLAAALLSRPERGGQLPAEAYVAAVLLGERLARRIAPLEGIRLVHDQ